MTTTEAANIMRHVSPTGVSWETAKLRVQHVDPVELTEPAAPAPRDARVDLLFDKLRSPLSVGRVEAILDALLPLASATDLLSRLADDKESTHLRVALIPVARRHIAGEFAPELRRVLVRLARHSDSAIRLAVADALADFRPGIDTKRALEILSKDPIGTVAGAARATLEDLS